MFRVLLFSCSFALLCLCGLATATGRNDCGQLGITGTMPKTSFTAVSGISGVVSASAGREFSCAVNDQGRLYTWGSPQNGQTGQGDEFKSLEKAGKWTYLLTKKPEICLQGDIVGVKLVDVKSGKDNRICVVVGRWAGRDQHANTTVLCCCCSVVVFVVVPLLLYPCCTLVAPTLCHSFIVGRTEPHGGVGRRRQSVHVGVRRLREMRPRHPPRPNGAQSVAHF